MVFIRFPQTVPNLSLDFTCRFTSPTPHPLCQLNIASVEKMLDFPSQFTIIHHFPLKKKLVFLQKFTIIHGFSTEIHHFPLLFPSFSHGFPRNTWFSPVAPGVLGVLRGAPRPVHGGAQGAEAAGGRATAGRAGGWDLEWRDTVVMCIYIYKCMCTYIVYVYVVCILCMYNII